MSRQASKSSLFSGSGSADEAVSKSAVARSRARRTTSSKSNFGGACGFPGSAGADRKVDGRAPERTRYLTSVRRLRSVIGFRTRRVMRRQFGGGAWLTGTHLFAQRQAEGFAFFGIRKRISVR